MTDFLCAMCMSWVHPAPQCNHDPFRICRTCGKRVGYRFELDDGRGSSPWQCAACQR